LPGTLKAIRGTSLRVVDDPVRFRIKHLPNLSSQLGVTVLVADTPIAVMDVNVHNVNISLTSWSRIRLEKLIVADLRTMPKDQVWPPRRALEVSLHEANER
jgi:hypothetical protein